MASQNVEDWELPLPPEPSTLDEEGEEEENISPEERIRLEKARKLQEYVMRMSYRPTPPPVAKPRTEYLAKPKRFVVMDNYYEFEKIFTPKERKQRIKRLAGKYTAMNTDQLEAIINAQRTKESKRGDLLKKKQDIYYRLLTKLEKQCRTQYLNLLVRKFGNFIAKLATTMKIPPQLIEPYARMQRGLFCNIILAIGLQPKNTASMYYNTPEASDYEMCHKIAHALLSLIIKGLDAASTKNPADIPCEETEFAMDNYIKHRLMCAAEKKVSNQCKKKKCNFDRLANIMKKCETFDKCPQSFI